MKVLYHTLETGLYINMMTIDSRLTIYANLIIM